MQYAYREMLSPHMIAVIFTTSAFIVGVFVAVGPIGNNEALTPLERLAFGAVYAMAGWPICYSMDVVALYFLRYRGLREVVAAMTLLALFEAFPCGAIAYTVDALVHRPPRKGFLDLYLLIATIVVACNLLFLYVVYQRMSRSTAPGAVATGTGGVTAAEQEVDSAADLAVRPARAHYGAESGTESAPAGDGGEPPARELPEEDEAAGTPTPFHASSESNGGMSPAAAASARPDVVSTPASPPNPDAPAAVRPELTPRLPVARNGTPAQQFRKPATILTMLPANVGTDVVYLKSEDHYIDVRTTVGSSLVKMRFSDAIADLGDRGIKVHRSYWVATSHVQRLVRTGKRTQIRLTGGHQVPVSVTHLPTVRAAVGR